MGSPGKLRTGGRAGEPGQRPRDHGFDRRSHQGLLHGERAGVPGLPPPLLDPRPLSKRRRKQPKFELILADGTVYPHIGSFFFADRQVDRSTGAIRVAALFPNPGNILRPGCTASCGPSNSSGGAAGPAARRYRTAGLLSGGRSRQRQQGQYPDGHGGGPRRLDVDRHQRIETGRAGNRRGRAKGPARHAR